MLGIGEIGLNKNSKNELIILEEQIALAAKHDQLILVHTPHLEDKLKGTKLIIDAIKRVGGGKIDPGRVLIDHVEEHTVEVVLDAGFWAGMTLYPDTNAPPSALRTSLRCTALSVCGSIPLATGATAIRSRCPSVNMNSNTAATLRK